LSPKVNILEPDLEEFQVWYLHSDERAERLCYQVNQRLRLQLTRQQDLILEKHPEKPIFQHFIQTQDHESWSLICNRSYRKLSPKGASGLFAEPTGGPSFLLASRQAASYLLVREGEWDNAFLATLEENLTTISGVRTIERVLLTPTKHILNLLFPQYYDETQQG